MFLAFLALNLRMSLLGTFLTISYKNASSDENLLRTFRAVTALSITPLPLYEFAGAFETFREIVPHFRCF